MNYKLEYIIIGFLLLLIVKLIYDSYKLYKKNKILSILKKMIRPYKSFLTLGDTLTCYNDNDNNSIDSLTGSYDSQYESVDNSTYEENLETRKTGYPYTDQGYPINLDQSLKAVLNNTDYNNENNENNSTNTNNDNDEYMKTQLNFNDKINNTSKDALDMVDKVNEYTMTGGVKCPTKIQDVYDNLTASPY